MLRNKYFFAGLGGLLLFVLIYNIVFFSGRGKGIDRPSAVPGTAVPGDEGLTVANSAQSQEGNGTGEWRRDPFWYPGGKTRSAPPTVSKAPGLRLEATMARGGKAFAIINGDIVGIGERLHGYVVTEIGDQFVKLNGPGGIRTLKLAGDTSEKE
jgi:hypothetical protein